MPENASCDITVGNITDKKWQRYINKRMAYRITIQARRLVKDKGAATKAQLINKTNRTTNIILKATKILKEATWQLIGEK